jgi:hypothetical protein
MPTTIKRKQLKKRYSVKRKVLKNKRITSRTTSRKLLHKKRKSQRSRITPSVKKNETNSFSFTDKSHTERNSRDAKRSNFLSIRRNKKYLGGGDWIVNDNLPDEDICPICHEKFSETPEQAIYKTDCNHVFHNNCLNEICIRSETGGVKPTCPICRKELDLNECTDMWAFKEGVLDTDGLKPEIKEIYDNQETIENKEKLHTVVANRIEDDE